jgi:hypothetical protein
MENISVMALISRMSAADFKAFKKAVRQLERAYVDTETACNMLLSAYAERQKMRYGYDTERKVKLAQR